MAGDTTMGKGACRALQGFALINLVVPVWVVATPLTIAGYVYSWSGAQLLLILQVVIAAALFYVAGQTAAGREIGRKTLPAVLVSYVLWLAMLRFWLYQV